MILSVDEYKKLNPADESSDEILAFKLEALESAICQYTNNNFINGYPSALKLVVYQMMMYDFKTADKVGIASETLSRHSVSYVDNTNSDSLLGYPKSIVSGLQPWIKARF